MHNTVHKIEKKKCKKLTKLKIKLKQKQNSINPVYCYKKENE